MQVLRDGEAMIDFQTGQYEARGETAGMVWELTARSGGPAHSEHRLDACNVCTRCGFVNPTGTCCLSWCWYAMADTPHGRVEADGFAHSSELAKGAAVAALRRILYAFGVKSVEDVVHTLRSLYEAVSDASPGRLDAARNVAGLVLSQVPEGVP